MTHKPVRALHEELMDTDPDYRREYEALEDEFTIAKEVIRARKQANLTQQQLAERMDTSQAAIARIEGGSLPSFRTLERLAEATGTRLTVRLEAR